MMENAAQFIQYIKNEKKKQGLTNDQLAEMTGISVGALNKLFSGAVSEPKLVTAVKLCEVLGCSLDCAVTGDAFSLAEDMPAENRSLSYLITEEEAALLNQIRRLDGYGKRLLRLIVAEELARTDSVSAETPRKGKILPAARVTPVKENLASAKKESVMAAYRTILLYDLPVSAGRGVYLDESESREINITAEGSERAAFALRVSGDSMEPKYHSGDILLIESCSEVAIGELGIFDIEGEAFFKRFNGDSLLSLNEKYAPIPIRDKNARCIGRVLSRLKKK